MWTRRNNKKREKPQDDSACVVMNLEQMPHSTKRELHEWLSIHNDRDGGSNFNGISHDVVQREPVNLFGLDTVILLQRCDKVHHYWEMHTHGPDDYT